MSRAARATDDHPVDPRQLQGRGPNNGSSDKNRTAAGISVSSSARPQYSSDSIDVLTGT
ncbi:hypothetical protein [Streptomyces coeruleorubidus]|uniref:hypothetical protein n=1 Tax=Streptomyces coeruleorubidus TaxID=116188 RepID=UPI0033D103D7